jgi:hypothetical protein
LRTGLLAGCPDNENRRCERKNGSIENRFHRVSLPVQPARLRTCFSNASAAEFRSPREAEKILAHPLQERSAQSLNPAPIRTSGHGTAAYVQFERIKFHRTLRPDITVFFGGNLERAKGFEPSTPTLARSCSTPELHPHPWEGRLNVTGDRQTYAKCGPRMQQPATGNRKRPKRPISLSF